MKRAKEEALWQWIHSKDYFSLRTELLFSTYYSVFIQNACMFYWDRTFKILARRTTELNERWGTLHNCSCALWFMNGIVVYIKQSHIWLYYYFHCSWIKDACAHLHAKIYFFLNQYDFVHSKYWQSKHLRSL